MANRAEISWEKKGKELISKNKMKFTYEDKCILYYLFEKQPLPDEMREEYWLIATETKIAKKNNPNYYSNLLNNFPKNNELNQNEIQISLDVNRTFPDDEKFMKKVKSLSNILVAYSRRNLLVGYCQGYNYIVGKILSITNDEENAFWIFVYIVENLLPINYSDGFFGVLVDNEIIYDLLNEEFKDLMENMKKLKFDLILKTMIYKWLICLFSQDLSDDLLFVIWDLFIIKGTSVLVKTIFAIINLKKNDFMKLKNLESFVDYFSKLKNLKMLNGIKKELIKEFLKRDYKINEGYNLEEKRKKKRKELIEQLEKLKLNKKTKNKIPKECDIRWSNCSSYKQNIIDSNVVVYRQFNKPKIIKSYFEKKFLNRNNSICIGELNYKKHFNKVMKYDEYEELVIQRRVHKCKMGIKKLIKEKTKSCINIREKEIRILIENNKIENNKKKETDNNNDNSELEGNVSDFTNTLKVVTEYYY